MIQEILEVTGNTILQCSLSATISVFLGVLGALGINSISNAKLRNLFEVFCFFTSFLPALFLIIAALNVISPFPYGLPGVVILHVISVVGFCSVLLARIFREKLSGLEVLSYLEGVSRFSFLKASLGYVKSDLTSLFVTVLLIMLTSFSIPFIVGYEYPMVETHIYKVIKTEASISKALCFAMLEILMVYLGVSILQSSSISEKKQTQPTRLLKSKVLLLIPLAPLIIIFFGLFLGSLNGFEQLERVGFGWKLFFTLSFKSIVIALLTGLACFVLFQALAWFYEKRIFLKNLYRIMIPGTALIGMSLWLLFPGGFAKDFQVILGFLILFFIPLYRLKFFDTLWALKQQVLVAELMGASKNLIYKKIIWPQTVDAALLLAGLSAFWALGDFALSHMVFGDSSTLALFIQSLAGQYRVEAASVLMFALFLEGSLVYIFFRSLKYVFR